MIEKLINGYLKIEPIEHSSFMTSQRDSYEEMGRVIASDSDIPVGAIVKFDSFMVKKYPKKDSKMFDWYVHKVEVVSYENEEISE